MGLREECHGVEVLSLIPHHVCSQQGWQSEGTNLVPISTGIRNVLAWDMSDANLSCTVVYFLNQSQEATHSSCLLQSPFQPLAVHLTTEGLLAPTAHPVAA